MKRNYSDLMSLDIYLDGISGEQYEAIKEDLPKPDSAPAPLSSWDFFMKGYHEKLNELRKEGDKKEVLNFASRFKWKNDLDRAFAESDYEALVITDADQKIIWVNEGFSKMTGYPKKFALNKKPSFLQGAETTKESRQVIREKLSKKKPFKTRVLNYRKDQSMYDCEVKIIPLFGERTTHYIAFEKEVI